jgi:hypothetical protein
LSTAPRVFISYSQDNDQHKEWVLELAKDLINNGVEVILDQWDLHPGQDVARFMEDGVTGSDRVILVSSERYVAKAESGKGGVGYERLIVTAELLTNIDTRKFIPILRNNTSDRKLPIFLGARLYVDFNSDDQYKNGLDRLLREIHQSPALEKPPLGLNPFTQKDQQTQEIPNHRNTYIPGESSELIWSNQWFSQEREKANSGLANLKLDGAMEVNYSLGTPINKRQTELLSAAQKAQIHTFGWPIGIVLDNRIEFRPKSRTDGIWAEILIEESISYDYWALKSNGDFFLLQSLFEDTRKPGNIFFNTRIVRVTEALMYCHRLYKNLDLDDDVIVAIRIAHQGLKGRILSTSNPSRVVTPETTTEDSCALEITARLGDMQSVLVDNVIRLTEPLFMIFNFTEYARQVYQGLVDGFIVGKVT